MAEKKAEAAEGEAPPKKKGKLLLFIIIGVLVIVLGGGGAAFFLLKKKPADDEEGDEAPAKEAKAKKGKKKDAAAAPPAFYKFDKPFTVKLRAEEHEAYLQVEAQLKLADLKDVDVLKAYDPEIKHRVTLLLLAKKVSELNTAAGVQALSNDIRDTINEILGGTVKKKPGGVAADEAEPDAQVQAVLFTTFIIQ